MTTIEEAIKYVKSNKKTLIEKYCGLDKYPPSSNPLTMFMAGSPGAGKTEFSKALIHQLEEISPAEKIIRLDVDEFRDEIPFYDGKNSDVVQRACSVLFDKIYDHIQDHNQNVLVDGTFSSPRSIENVKRSINKNRRVGITYIYQNPVTAWKFTKMREKLEGRSVPMEMFTRAYFESKNNANLVKATYQEKVILDLFIKDKDNKVSGKGEFNIDNLDNYIKEKYTIGSLEAELKNIQ